VSESEQTHLLREMRDLLRVIAEPALAKRDEKLRAALREVIGRSKGNAKAAFLMDGSRSQAAITKEAGIDQGNLSRLAKTLHARGLISDNEKQPKLQVPIPTNFFETSEKENGR
jgi:hypothetical protein